MAGRAISRTAPAAPTGRSRCYRRRMRTSCRRRRDRRRRCRRVIAERRWAIPLRSDRQPRQQNWRRAAADLPEPSAAWSVPCFQAPVASVCKRQAAPHSSLRPSADRSKFPSQCSATKSCPPTRLSVSGATPSPLSDTLVERRPLHQHDDLGADLDPRCKISDVIVIHADAA